MAVHIELQQGSHKAQLPKLAMSGASREYYTLPDFFYFRLKATPPSFLKVHWREQIGVVPQACVMQHRRARSNEGHAFRIYR